MNQLAVATCVLPGCTTVVADPTQPCDGCLAIFGTYLRESGEHTLTAEAVEERDQGVRDAYSMQAATVAADSEPGGAETAARWLARRQLENQSITLSAAVSKVVDAIPVRKAMQLCWLCEQRRTCTHVNGRWECNNCQEIV